MYACKETKISAKDKIVYKVIIKPYMCVKNTKNFCVKFRIFIFIAYF